jgi:hypothetical protein
LVPFTNFHGSYFEDVVPVGMREHPLFLFCVWGQNDRTPPIVIFL